MDRTQASRRRLLDAAASEFAAHGIAGARVDRISTKAKVSKAQMYAYYSNKEALFDAVLADQFQETIDAVPYTLDDLVRYAIGVFEACVRRPHMVRLATWARLERAPTGRLFREIDEPKIQVLARAQHDGLMSSTVPAEDLYDMLLALALTWSSGSLTFTSSQLDSAKEHQRRRASLATAVTRALAPDSASR
ncbi:TetR family transcriptional regulator [Streptomyces ardesiacus]|uniref:TetR/AcrR family transcriptional regulator n=1 Tax=Streptomyces ardesiacus TaxID=285564 RepID=UPI003F4A140D